MLHLANDFKIDTIFIVLGLFVLAVIARDLKRTVRHSRAMRRFAQRHRLMYVGETLPEDFKLEQTTFAKKNGTVANCIVGEIKGKRFTVFDLEYKEGKLGVHETVTAFPRADFAEFREERLRFSGDFEIETAGEWFLVYEPKTLVQPNILKYWIPEARVFLVEVMDDPAREANSEVNAMW